MFKDEKSAGEAWRANLERAADIMQERGHSRGAYYGPGGRVCTMNAIALSLGVNPLHLAPYTGASRARSDEVDAFLAFVGARNVCDWNNEPGRTKLEVVDALRGAARA